jgi:hypothetical protein
MRERGRWRIGTTWYSVPRLDNEDSPLLLLLLTIVTIQVLRGHQVFIQVILPQAVVPKP